MLTSMMRRLHLQSVGFAVVLVVVALATAGQASATCLNPDSVKLGLSSTAHFVPAIDRADALRERELVSVSDSDDEGSSIVGLWQFKFAGFLVDWGSQAFHSDGTELIFSGGQNPETGDVCQGVWRKVGPNTYTLNHIAMGWFAPGAGFGVRVHFHMIIKLDADGDSFTGTYKAAVYAVSPANPFDESAQMEAGTGTVSASRVKPD